MKLSELKNILSGLNSVEFILDNGELVPNHFHVTEVGMVEKKFIDCGGTVRNERVVNFQLWTSSDYDHRLSSEKLSGIIGMSEDVLGLSDKEIEVEYQGNTIGKYGLEFDGFRLVLVNKSTDCLAKDNCGVPEVKSVETVDGCCSPSSGCC